MEDGWQPIETAPKDRDVLLFGLRAAEVSGRDQTPSVTIGSYSPNGDYEGFDWLETHGDAYAVWVKPTHWMPLPKAPA